MAMKIVFCAGIRGMRIRRRRYGEFKLSELGSVTSFGRRDALDAAKAH